MSRSLSRIRALVTEIEEIHRNGQHGGYSTLSRSENVKQAQAIHIAPTPLQAPLQAAAHPAASMATPLTTTATQASTSVPPPTDSAPISAEVVARELAATPVENQTHTSSQEIKDPFAALDDVVHLNVAEVSSNTFSAQAIYASAHDQAHAQSHSAQPHDEEHAREYFEEFERKLTQEIPPPGKVSMQLAGSVTLQLQIENANETIELKQIGNMLEIRFADGKAFHLPLKSVA